MMLNSKKKSLWSVFLALLFLIAVPAASATTYYRSPPYDYGWAGYVEGGPFADADAYSSPSTGYQGVYGYSHWLEYTNSWSWMLIYFTPQYTTQITVEVKVHFTYRLHCNPTWGNFAEIRAQIVLMDDYQDSELGVLERSTILYDKVTKGQPDKNVDLTNTYVRSFTYVLVGGTRYRVGIQLRGNTDQAAIVDKYQVGGRWAETYTYYIKITY